MRDNGIVREKFILDDDSVVINIDVSTTEKRGMNFRKIRRSFIVLRDKNWELYKICLSLVALDRVWFSYNEDILLSMERDEYLS